MKSANTRVLGIAAAAILALVGGALLWQNSGSSESEATEAPVELVDVLVASKDITRDTSAASLVANAYVFVETRQVRADQLQPGAVTTIDELTAVADAGNVTVRSVPAGTQLTASDFVVPGAQTVSALPNVDPGLFEFTFALDPQRVVGGTVRVGQYVAVVGSFDPADGEPGQTVTVADHVLVTNVQTEQVLSEAQLSNDALAPSLAPTSRLFVTVGVQVDDLERLAYAVEFGRVWLARQGEQAVTDGSEIRQRDNVVVTLDGAGAAPSTVTASEG
jgi:pilus assembly protein CpaB